MEKLFETVGIFLLICTINSCNKEEETREPDLAWLGEELVTINSVDPYVNDNGLDIILQKVGDAQIVGLGEGTHGTTEFWSIRQKITRYLVEKKGFSAILFEASFPGSFALHDYVTTGTGIASEAHYKLGTWRYLEMQNLISWMRQYNVDHSGTGNEPSLHFYGYDCAFSNWTEPINLITSYLQVVDAGEAENINTRLLQHTKEDAIYVHDFFSTKESLYTSLSSEEEYQTIFRIVSNLLPSWECWNRLSLDKPTLQYRDSVNIQNVNWIIENLVNGGKVIIWAHNAHVRNGYSPDAEGTIARMLGSRLHEKYGSSYYTIATQFYDGNFLAWDECEDHDFLFINHQAAIPPVDSYPGLFWQTGVPLFFLDLSQIDYTGNRTSWLLEPRMLREIGATYCKYSDLQYYYNLSLPENYDGIVFVKTSHPITKINF
jgi:erythromycin esterase